MQFYEKLVFLLKLTQTTNRTLARELKVDPSLISRLRTGSRGIPRNHQHIEAMARYFSKRCTTEYQRQALSEMLEIKQALTMTQDALSQVLYYWLCGESDEVGRFIRTFEEINLEALDSGPIMESHPLSTGSLVYYGNEGKRAAARAVYQHLLSLEDPGTIYLFSDEADDWILEDSGFPRSVQDWGLDLVRRGFQFCQIAPPTTSVDQAFESLTRWLPLYLTGQVTAYFYPRLRDNVHRRTLIVMPGEIAMTSSSIGNQRSSRVTVLTTERRLTVTYSMEFQEYLSLCIPLLNIYATPERLMQCFTQFLSLSGAHIQKVTSLSAETAPPQLVDYCIQQMNPSNRKIMLSLYRQEMEQLGETRVQHELIDIAHLASAEEVREGKVPIVISYGFDSSPLFYTPETYVLHLKNILRLLETCENYHFVPIRIRDQQEGTLMVKEGQRAVLMRLTPSLTAFEISQLALVQLCREHLLRLADRIGYTGINRTKIISQIKERIRELQA